MELSLRLYLDSKKLPWICTRGKKKEKKVYNDFQVESWKVKLNLNKKLNPLCSQMFHNLWCPQSRPAMYIFAFNTWAKLRVWRNTGLYYLKYIKNDLTRTYVKLLATWNLYGSESSQRYKILTLDRTIWRCN